MNEKDKTLLIRISQEMADDISEWSDKVQTNKSTLVRTSIKHYIDYLESENLEVLELIKGIIMTKIDRIQAAYNEGRLIAFTQIIRVSTTLHCNLCRDEQDNEYVVYNIPQSKDQSVLDAIQLYAEKLYSIWRNLPEPDRKNFLVDLQMNHVYFSIQVDA
jgi:predicted DNA-binding protein